MCAASGQRHRLGAGGLSGAGLDITVLVGEHPEVTGGPRMEALVALTGLVSQEDS